jgi:DNA-directed RNA polymerase specialized sigma24 family protein
VDIDTRGRPPGAAEADAGVTGLVKLTVIMLGDRAAAEDVVQDAFFGLYRNWGRLSDPGKALAYVRGSVLNGCRAALRQWARHRRRERAGRGARARRRVRRVDGAAGRRASRGARRGAPTARPAARGAGAAVLPRVPEEETARAVGVSRGTVKSSTSRALRALGTDAGGGVMTSVEARTRAAMDAITGQVDAPPLLPPPAGTARRRRGRPPQRRWRPWLAPAAAAAAAAIIAVAVTLVAVRNAPAGRPAPPAPATPVNGVPRYYVGIPTSPHFENQAAPEAIVGDTFTGKKLATVPAPAGWRFLPAMAAAGDDRTFVVGATPRSGDLLRTERLYVIRLTPGAAHFATLRELPIPAPQVSWSYVSSMALSRDGTMLAVMAEATQARVYSMTTGALLHTWSVSSSGSSGPPPVSLLSWTSDGRRLAFSAREARSNPPLNIRLLQVYDPGHDLFADSRVVLTVSPSGCGSSMVSGDGKTVLCGSSALVRGPGPSSSNKACPGGARPQTAAIHQYSTATAKLTGTLYHIERSCDTDGTTLSWTSDDGNAVLGYLTDNFGGVRFGLFTPGKFTPLPAPLAYPAFAAW